MTSVRKNGRRIKTRMGHKFRFKREWKDSSLGKRMIELFRKAVIDSVHRALAKTILQEMRGEELTPEQNLLDEVAA